MFLPKHLVEDCEDKDASACKKEMRDAIQTKSREALKAAIEKAEALKSAELEKPIEYCKLKIEVMGE